MLELGGRERHFFSGLVVQVLVVALMVFAYTQAGRQVKYRRNQYLQRKEQLAQAQSQATRIQKPDLDRLRAQIGKLEGFLPSSEALAAWADRLEVLARDQYGFRNLQVKVGRLEEPMAASLPQEDLPSPITMRSLDLQGVASSRDIAGLLIALNDSELKLLCPLEVMELMANGEPPLLPVGLHLKWAVATSTASSRRISSGPWPPATPVLKWGEREEPFWSPLTQPRALQISGEVFSRFQLTGISWTGEEPTCVINKTSLKLGDSIQGYQLVLLTPRSVILEKAGEEIFLSLP